MVGWQSSLECRGLGPAGRPLPCGKPSSSSRPHQQWQPPLLHLPRSRSRCGAARRPDPQPAGPPLAAGPQPPGRPPAPCTAALRPVHGRRGAVIELSFDAGCSARDRVHEADPCRAAPQPARQQCTDGGGAGRACQLTKPSGLAGSRMHQRQHPRCVAVRPVGVVITPNEAGKQQATLPPSAAATAASPHLQQRRRELLLLHAAAEAHRRQLALHSRNVLCHIWRRHRVQRLQSG